MTWRDRPVIYEIATWVWLDELRARYLEPLTLATIPAQEWDALAELDVDAVWLMGVWERSPAGVAVANANPDLQAEFRHVLPDYRPEDNIGSAYCVRDYVVAAHLGGPDALAKARAELECAGAAPRARFRPQPCGDGSSVGVAASRVFHPRQL